jgi:hypothetical protein
MLVDWAGQHLRNLRGFAPAQSRRWREGRRPPVQPVVVDEDPHATDGLAARFGLRGHPLHEADVVEKDLTVDVSHSTHRWPVGGTEPRERSQRAEIGVCRRPAQPGVQPQLDPPSHRLSEPRLHNQFEVQIARAVGPNIRKVSRRPYVAVQQIHRRAGGQELGGRPT